ncbi:unnamed protein product, partial [Dovyalis caffra]
VPLPANDKNVTEPHPSMLDYRSSCQKCKRGTHANVRHNDVVRVSQTSVVSCRIPPTNYCHDNIQTSLVGEKLKSNDQNLVLEHSCGSDSEPRDVTLLFFRTSSISSN